MNRQLICRYDYELKSAFKFVEDKPHLFTLIIEDFVVDTKSIEGQTITNISSNVSDRIVESSYSNFDKKMVEEEDRKLVLKHLANKYPTLLLNNFNIYYSIINEGYTLHYHGQLKGYINISHDFTNDSKSIRTITFYPNVLPDCFYYYPGGAPDLLIIEDFRNRDLNHLLEEHLEIKKVTGDPK